MAEAIVGPLLSKLLEVAVKEAKALAAVGGEIDKLRDKLLWLHALAHEAELQNRHDGSRLVQVLAFQIRDAGFDAEDAVDHFFLQGISLLRRFGRYNWRRISKEFILHFWTHIRARAILSGRIQSVNVRLEEIIGNKSTYTLSKNSSGDGKTWRASRAIPPMRIDWDWDYSKKFELKCRKRGVDDLMTEIKNETVSEVITVVGVEGVGKTALLTHVYKQEFIKNEFKVRIWLSFPPDISDESMLQKINQELGNKAKEMGKDPKKVRCLVVIDNPVNTTMTWRKLEKKILEEEVGKGSKILLSVTSSWHEEYKKATEDSEEHSHGTTIILRPLQKEESKTLFNHVYGLEGRRSTNYKVAEMDHIRNFILEITNGLPLAVVLVAKLMRTMDMGKWEAAGAYLKCNTEDSKLKTILSVCVDDLSDELKSCLLYTAGFPENRPIDAHKLVRLWMAEGFLTQQHKLETEELGQCYLKELIYRGLLHLHKKAPGGNVLWVAIPHQIHPLLRSEAQRTSFMHLHYGGSLPPPGNTRRLALHGYNDKFPALDNCMEKLRTVVSYSDDYMDYPCGHKQEKSSKDGPEPKPEPKLDMRKFLERSPYLRVINLESIQVMKKKKKGDVCALPRAIGDMVHLQYLGIQCQELKEVPSSIGNLQNLQTIDVRGTGVRSLPDSLWKVKTLRHVLGDKLAFPRSSTGVGDDLKLMQTLDSVTIDHQYDGSCKCTTDAACKRRKLQLLRFRSLHRLHVGELKESQGKDLAYVLKDLESLEALILSGEHIPMDLFAEASEATPSWMKDMESLMLDGPLHPQDASYKKLVGDPCLGRYLLNVTHLVLRSTDIGKEFIHWIGNLPVLAELELLEGSYNKKKLTFGPSEFKSLTILKISSLDKLDEIIFLSDATAGSKRSEAINIDVPDHVVTTDKYIPSEQPPIAGTPVNGQQAEGGDEHDQSTSNDLSSHNHKGPHQAAAATTTHGDGGQPMEGGSLLQYKHRIITELILEAANENKTTKKTISDYIIDTYVATCLDNMVESKNLTRTNHGRYDTYAIPRQ